jgi:hypothetical protein
MSVCKVTCCKLDGQGLIPGRSRVLSSSASWQTCVVLQWDFPCLCCSWRWVRLCLWNVATNGPVVHPPYDIWVWSPSAIMYTGKLITQRKSCSSAALSTTNPTWTDLGVNLDLYSERLVTNCLNPDMASLAIHKGQRLNTGECTRIFTLCICFVICFSLLPYLYFLSGATQPVKWISV